MGFYLEVDSKGRALGSKGKADRLIADGAREVGPSFQQRLVCVVDNGAFEAAGLCHSPQKFLEFSDPMDKRAKRWLRVTPAQLYRNFASGTLEDLGVSMAEEEGEEREELDIFMDKLKQFVIEQDSSIRVVLIGTDGKSLRTIGDGGTMLTAMLLKAAYSRASKDALGEFVGQYNQHKEDN